MLVSFGHAVIGPIGLVGSLVFQPNYEHGVANAGFVVVAVVNVAA